MRELVDEVGDGQQRHDRDHECAAFDLFASCHRAHNGSAFRASSEEKGRDKRGGCSDDGEV